MRECLSRVLHQHRGGAGPVRFIFWQAFAIVIGDFLSTGEKRPGII
jgi:hypothetical protein